MIDTGIKPCPLVYLLVSEKEKLKASGNVNKVIYLLVAKIKDLQRDMVLYQTYLNDFERQSEALAGNEEKDDAGEDESALFTSSFQ